MKTLSKIERTANNLLVTFEGIEWLSLKSWFADIADTMEFYNLTQYEAKQAHDLAYYIYLNES